MSIGSKCSGSLPRGFRSNNGILLMGEWLKIHRDKGKDSVIANFIQANPNLPLATLCSYSLKVVYCIIALCLPDTFG